MIKKCVNSVIIMYVRDIKAHAENIDSMISWIVVLSGLKNF